MARCNPNIPLRRTAEAQDLDDRGEPSNGCGSGWFSHFLCNMLQRMFGIHLEECWHWHDLEYALSRTIKSRQRRLTADTDLQWNIDISLGLDPDMPDELRSHTPNPWLYKFGSLVHWALILKGSKAYWR